MTVGELQEIAGKINTSLEYLISLADEALPSNAETDKQVRINFLLDPEYHEALMSLVYLKDTTMTAILTEAIEAYIQGYSEEIAVLQETRRKLRGK